MGDVVEFPASKHFEKQAAKGKKVTQQAALEALVEMKQMVQGIASAVGRLASAQQAYEGILQRIDTNAGVLMSMLIEKGVFSREDWNNAWKKYVEEPQEKAMDKHIEQMKTASAEDAYYAALIEAVRKHTFADRTEGGKTYAGKQVRDFYLQMLLDPSTRAAAIPDIQKEIPEVSSLKIEEEKVEAEPTPEPGKRPDCGYCGKADCAFCTPPQVTPVEASPLPLPVDNCVDRAVSCKPEPEGDGCLHCDEDS